MSSRSRFALPSILSVVAISALAVLAGCGGGSGTATGVAPPSGGFSASNLNGTYVFSVSGSDVNGDPYAIVGTITANGSGGITGGAMDINDAGFASLTPAVAPTADSTIAAGSYTVGQDGRGQAKFGTSTPFTTVVLDFVLQDNSHGLVTEFDSNASGSGTLDLQASNTTPSGTYAFSFAGSYGTSSMATVGNFTAGTAVSGLEDFNASGAVYNSSGAGDTVSGKVVAGPSSTPASELVTTNFSIVYDVYPIDATHLKFIEMDANGTLSGDAYSQSSTAMPASSTLAFTLMGGTSSSVLAAGGFMVTDGSGNLTNSSSEDVNNDGSASPEPITFSAQTTAGGTGRYTLSLSGFTGGTEYVAYPSSGGLLLLEIDGTGALMSGAAYTQSANATFGVPQGYALNLVGTNISAQVPEVDDIAEFASASSGTTVTGVLDENYAPSGVPNYGLALSGTYTAPSSGRGAVVANVGSTSNGSINGGFGLTFYTVDGTTFPFIETDSGQVASGVFVLQNSGSSSSAKSHLFVVHPLVRPHGAFKKRQRS